MFIQIFVEWVRSWVLSAKRHPIQNLGVEQYIRSMGQIFAAVCTANLRIYATGSLDFSMEQQLASYAHKYPPPYLLLSLTVYILQCLDTTTQCGIPIQQYISDLACVTFFLLLQIG